MASISILSSLLFTLLLISSSMFADGLQNVLLTGESLGTDGHLTYNGNEFILQGDCNLVLYVVEGKGFQSNTSGRGRNCTLHLNRRGQLVINNAYGSVVWISDSKPAGEGKYAAVMRPDGQVAVYGPQLWSVPAAQLDSSSNSLRGNIPMVRNLLFSSQSLYDNDYIATRDYKLVMTSDCNLKLVNPGVGITWESGTTGNGENCFVRLDHYGVLSIFDDKCRTLWWSVHFGTRGDYVLILENSGHASVYGRIVWITNNPPVAAY